MSDEPGIPAFIEVKLDEFKPVDECGHGDLTAALEVARDRKDDHTVRQVEHLLRRHDARSN